MDKNNNGTCHIISASRHLLTIGSDLIENKYTVVELVKNPLWL